MQVRILPGAQVYQRARGCKVEHMKPFLALLCASLMAGCAGLPYGSHPLTSPALINEDDGVHLTMPGITIEVEHPKPKSNGTTEQIILIEAQGIVLFAINSAQISHESENNLDSAVAFLIKNVDLKKAHLDVSVEGHASSDGPATYNKELSERRAANVAAYLKASLDKADVKDVTFDVKAMGAEAPTPENSTQSRRRLDKNAEIDIKVVITVQK